MEYKSRKPNRLSINDYSQVGSYFVTICTQNRKALFEMELYDTPISAASNLVIHKWLTETTSKFPNITIDKYIIMPDHIHLLITIKERHIGRSLPDVIHFFKTMTTNEYIRGVKGGKLTPFETKLWQKSYYDHVIRNQQDYDEIWTYIENNPTKWMMVHNPTP